MKELLSINWNTKYECPGGDCGLTCCSGDWKILLQDSEIENYKKISSPFREELMNSIDEKEKCMKCADGKCVLLDEKQFCKLVLACGPEALSYTCSAFPYKNSDFGLINEAMVEIVCPMVAEFLFDEEPIELFGGEIEGEVSGTQEECDTYISLYSSRNKLMNIMHMYPKNFIFGKQFLLFSVFEGIKKLISSNQLNMNNINLLLDGYCNEVVLYQILEQCDQIGSMLDKKAEVMFRTLLDLQSGSVLPAIAEILYEHKPFVINHVAEYLYSKEKFAQSLERYVAYIKENYPSFIENFMMYILVLDWTTNKKNDFGVRFLARFIELFVIQIAGMALLDETGKLERKEFSVFISAIDRKFAHNLNMNKQLNDYLEKKQMEDAAFLMMLLAN